MVDILVDVTIIWYLTFQNLGVLYSKTQLNAFNTLTPTVETTINVNVYTRLLSPEFQCSVTTERVHS